MKDKKTHLETRHYLKLNHNENTYIYEMYLQQYKREMYVITYITKNKGRKSKGRPLW